MANQPRTTYRKDPANPERGSNRPPRLRHAPVTSRGPAWYTQATRAIHTGGPGAPPPGFVTATTSGDEWMWYWASMRVLDPDRDPTQPPFYGGKDWDYQCFHPDTELLTVAGWKPVGEIDAGEVVATMDPKTRELTYAPVSATHAYPFSGSLVTAHQERGVSIAVTPNHTMWVSHGDRKKRRALYPTPASSLLTMKRIPNIPQWAKWSSGIPAPGMTFRSRNYDNTATFTGEQWASFLGWYVAEGSAGIYGGKHEIKISQVNEAGKEILRDLLDECDLSFSESDRGFRIYCSGLCEYLMSLGKSNDKHVPDDVRFWDRPSLLLFLDALIEGDGTWCGDDPDGRDNGHLVTSSSRLVDDVCEIAIKAGYRPTYRVRQDNPPDSPFGTKPRYHVSLWRMHHDTQVRGWREMPYDGPVYCVTVEPFHTVLTRLNNRISWSGQSPEMGGFTRALGSSVVDFLYKLAFPFIVVRIQTYRWHEAADATKQAFDQASLVKLTGKFETVDVFSQDYLGDTTGEAAIVLLKETLGLVRRRNVLSSGAALLVRPGSLTP